eukprot:CAMPEP_0114559790 /NCGR_PEP_ID=MMETSP0114-20121206/11106_1 /TAXON_ID=31324 /ORGANISM="Goniomonas sp, Strain m" /LENGTH=465 /DNA_ID=CAMNT_0001745277 /DNA_START=56 /DNA_END=1453 /DNA_ORIENTATION=+
MSRSVIEDLGDGCYRVKGDPWSIGSRYELDALIGNGSYGSVCRALDKNARPPRYVAIKKIWGVFQSRTDGLRCLREISILRRLEHPNVVGIVDVLDPTSEPITDLYVVFEFGGSDLSKLSSVLGRLLGAEEVRKIAYQLLCAVGYLHDSQVIHRDIKPANVLIDPETMCVKLADFGLSRVLMKGIKAAVTGQDQDAGRGAAGPTFDGAGAGAGAQTMPRFMSEHVVTRWYRSPEVILCHGFYSTKIDMWSIGCIYAELLGMMQSNRKPLFPGRSCFPFSPGDNRGSMQKVSPTDRLDQLNVILSVIGTPDEESIRSLHVTQDVRSYLKELKFVPPADLREKYPLASDEAIDLIRRMLLFNPDRRISIQDALKHRYFAGFPAPPVCPNAASAMLKMDLESVIGPREQMIRSLDALIRREIHRHHQGINEIAESSSGEAPQPDLAAPGLFSDPAAGQGPAAEDPMTE